MKVYTIFGILPLRLIKYLVAALLLACFVNGFSFNITLIIAYWSYLGVSFVIEWIAYNVTEFHNKVILYIVWVIIGMSTIYTSGNPYGVILNIIIFGILLHHLFHVHSLNFRKYNNDLLYIEKIASAQNNHNIELLSQYAKEKAPLFSLGQRDLSLSNMKRLRYPIPWKLMLSIIRTDFKFLLFGYVVFLMSYIIYNTTLLSDFPIFETPAFRYTLILFGIVFMIQNTIRIIVQEFERLQLKQQMGLYIPKSLNRLIKEYSLFPSIALAVTTLIVMLMCRSNPIYSFAFFIFLRIYIYISLILTAKSPNILKRVYPILGVLLFAISNILLI